MSRLMRRRRALTNSLSTPVSFWVVATSCLQKVSFNTCTSAFFNSLTSSEVTFQPASVGDVMAVE